MDSKILVIVLESSEDRPYLGLCDIKETEYSEMSQISDGYHTFDELYHYRALYNAAFFNQLYANYQEHDTLEGVPIKSWRHSDGELCFGGGWFIVMVTLPTGQISNHYEAKYWDMFNISEAKIGLEYDGHTPQEAADRLESYLKQ